MGLAEEITEDMKDAMRARDKVRLLTIRGIRAAFLNAMKSNGSDTLPDDKAIAILRKLAKQRKDSMEAFQGAGRDDLYQNEVAELAIIDAYLPSLASEDTTRGWVEAAIAQTGAEGPGGVGRVMGAVMGAHKGEIDGNLAREIAQQLLGG